MNINKTINLNKKIIIIILFIIGIVFFSSYSYALFQVSVIKNNVVVLRTTNNLNITTTIDNTNSDTFTLNGKSSTTITVHLTTDNITSAMAYKMYYEVIGTGTFTVTSNENFPNDKIEGVMQPIVKSGYDYKVTGKDITFTVTSNSSNTLTITLGAIGGYEKTGASLTTQDELVLNTNLGIEPPTAAQTLINNASTIGLEQLGDAYRYVGSNPNNYVWFNNEQWRIIGVYTFHDSTTNIDTKHLKIIRATPLSSSLAYNSEPTSNAWNGSTMKTYLANTYYPTMTATAQAMVEEQASWMVGRAAMSDNAGLAYTAASGTPWTGKIGLAASYEYLYAGGTSCQNTAGNNYNCTSQNWLYKVLTNQGVVIGCFITPNSSNSSTVLVVINYNGSVNNVIVSNTIATTPVVYLQSGVTIESGNGQSGQTNSYKLACTTCTSS